jgi:acyl dehydratase
MPAKHILHQGPVLRALGRAALSGLLQRAPRQAAPPATPGREIQATLPARPEALVRDYLRHVGGDPAAYRGTVPAHLFPQWGFPLAARTLEGLPYPLIKVMNGGCRLEMNAPLPAGEELLVSARLEGIDDDGRRAILHQRIVTSTKSAPEAVVAHLYAYVPLAAKEGSEPKKPKERARVPEAARELAFWRIGPRAGLAFATLTGDFNPVHWVPAYARAFGFRSVILHGFSTLARAVEGLNRALFAGAVQRLRTIDVRFVKPLVLPARVGLYTAGSRVFVGDAPGGGAYLEGDFCIREDA